MQLFKRRMGKKAISIAALSMMAILFGVAIIATSIVADIVTDIRTTQTTDSASYNISTKGLSGTLNLAARYPTIGTVIGAAVIIGILLTYLARQP